MLPLLALVVCWGGCTANVEGVAILADASPIIVKKPPTTKEITAPGCDNITNLGQCEEGVATVCDPQRDILVKTDCTALGQDCVVDLHEGAGCRQLKPQQAADPATSCPGGKVDVLGYCEGNVAIWCEQDQSPRVTSWDCSKQDKVCVPNKCREGAYCCSDSSTEPEGCGELDLFGKCTPDNKATWCEDGEVFVLDCTARGDECKEEDCVMGAYCCPPDSGEECGSLGPEGQCVGNLLRYCSVTGVIEEEECQAPTRCEFNTCLTGFAFCCAF